MAYTEPTLTPFRRFTMLGATVRMPIGEDTRYGESIMQYLTVEVFPLTYENIVSTIMNELYPSDKVQALTANYNEAKDDEELSEDKRKEYMDEYHAYQAKRKEVKAFAKEILTNQLNIQ